LCKENLKKKMKKLKEQVEVIQDLENLIPMMMEQIEFLRVMVYRYNKMHGEVINGEVLEELPITKDFVIGIENENVVCKIETNRKSNYLKIKEVIKKLS